MFVKDINPENSPNQDEEDSIFTGEISDIEEQTDDILEA